MLRLWTMCITSPNRVALRGRISGVVIVGAIRTHILVAEFDVVIVGAIRTHILVADFFRVGILTSAL